MVRNSVRSCRASCGVPAKNIQMVFQDPMRRSTAHARRRDIVAEGMHSFGIGEMTPSAPSVSFHDAQARPARP